MDLETLSLILTGVVCGCCVILCIVVTYLCVVVRRIRRKLNDLSGDGTKHLVRANNKSKDAEKRISAGLRYTGEPRAPERAPSAVYQDPQETVTRMEREAGQAVPVSSVFPQALESSSSTQNITERAEKPEQIPLQTLQFVNKGFNADCARDSTGERSSEAGDSQPIYDNQPEAFSDEPIYENNNDEDETIYQNTGELRVINNPEWARSNTMDISQIP